jgi:hypothetical protein
MRRRDRLEVCKERQVPRVQVASEFVFAISINTLSCFEGSTGDGLRRPQPLPQVNGPSSGWSTSTPVVISFLGLKSPLEDKY